MICFVADAVVVMLIVALIITLYEKTLRSDIKHKSSVIDRPRLIVSRFRSVVLVSALAQQVPHRSQRKMLEIFKAAEQRVSWLLRDTPLDDVSYFSLMFDVVSCG
jgi:hypothetical protein